MRTSKIQNGQQGLKRSSFFGAPSELLQNKFFDSNTPSLKKGTEEKKVGGVEEYQPSAGALTHPLQPHTALNTSPPTKCTMATRGPQYGQEVQERGPTIGCLINFC